MTPGGNILAKTPGGGITIHADLTGLGADDHDVYVLHDGTRDMTGNLLMQHIGIGGTTPTATHSLINSEAFTGSGTKIGIGNFPSFAPTVLAANTIVAVQGNVWFGGTNWAAGSGIRALDFFPAPFNAVGVNGSVVLNVYGINTGGMLNVGARTITANNVTGILSIGATNIFGGVGVTNFGIVRGVWIPSAMTPSTLGSAWGRVCGLEINPQPVHANVGVTQGAWMAGDGIGSDIAFGAGDVNENADALIYYNGTNFIIDPDNVGSGIVLIGVTGDDNMRLTDIEIDGDLNHDGSNVGFFGTAPAAQSAAYNITNVTTDRDYDASAPPGDQVLADTLGTLIQDLQALGIIG